MPSHDLNQPLRRKARSGGHRSRPAAPAAVAAALLLASAADVWIAVVDDPNGGYPVAVARIEDAPASTGSLGREPAAIEQRAAAPGPGEQDVALVAMPPLRGANAGDAPLTEPSAFGPLPRVSPDGRRPRDAYARRAPATPPGAPRIALVVGGLGLSQTGTQKAIETLPEDVTLAFAPLGGSLQRWVDKARGEGHEVVLQVPMEPLGYPEENPGEHTLLVSSDQSGTQQDLHWLLGRMTAYAGVMNYMGARFTAEDDAMLPFLGEIGERGLYFLDDGSSPASRAAAIGAALQVPVVTADAVVDADRSPEAITRELRLLESIAASRGVAVGVASAFPGTVDAIAAWIVEAESRGVVLIPVSAASRAP